MMQLLADSVAVPYLPDFSTPGRSLAPFAGELALLGGLIASLLIPFATRTAVALKVGIVVIFAMLLALGLSVFNRTPAGAAFGGMLVVDSMGRFWKSILLIFSIGVGLMWMGSTRYRSRDGDSAEYFTLLITAILGMSLLGQTSNLLMLFLAGEIASMPSYLLAAFRKTNRLAAESGIKFILFGAVTTGIMVYGLSLLYGMHRTLEFSVIAQSLQTQMPLVSVLGLICLMVGIGFKISLVPTHFWAPDVFEGAGIEISALLSVASKGAGIVLLVRLAMLIIDSGNAPMLMTALGILGAITATVGNLGAMRQSSIKRLLAYSSIAHAGYIVTVLLFFRPGQAQQALTTIGIYLIAYLFMNLGAFAVAAQVESAGGQDRIDDYNGLGVRSPMLAVSMTVCLISLVGLPPAVGFWAKFKVLQTLAGGGAIGWILVGVVGVNSIVSLYYYAKIIRAIYLEKTDRLPMSPGVLCGGVALASAGVLVMLFIAYRAVEYVSQAMAHPLGAMVGSP